MKQRPWIDNERLIEVAQDMQVCFEFNLHSRSTPNEIALVARQYLIDEGLPHPKTVCLYGHTVFLLSIQEHAPLVLYPLAPCIPLRLCVE